MSTSAPHRAQSLEPITDEELADLALAADPDVEVEDDAVSLWDLAATEQESPMPSWDMPSPMAGGRLLYGWRRWGVLLGIASLVVSNAHRLHSTSVAGRG